MFTFFLVGHGLIISDLFSDPRNGVANLWWIEALVAWLIFGALSGYLFGIKDGTKLSYLAVLWTLLYFFNTSLILELKSYFSSLMLNIHPLMLSISLSSSVTGGLGGILTILTITKYHSIRLNLLQIISLWLILSLVFLLGAYSAFILAYIMMMIFNATINSLFSLGFGLGMSIGGLIIGYFVYLLIIKSLKNK